MERTFTFHLSHLISVQMFDHIRGPRGPRRSRVMSRSRGAFLYIYIYMCGCVKKMIEKKGLKNKEEETTCTRNWQ